MKKKVAPAYRTRYHRQDTAITCGNAVAQIIVNSVDNDPQVEIISQQTTLTNELDGGNWYTEPANLELSLNTREKIGANFALFACDTEEAISRRIVVTLFQAEVAAAALVWDDKHWVVVYGCNVTREPAKVNGKYDPEDRGYTIREFLVRDPAPERIGAGVNEQPGFQHTLGDQCGTGGTQGHHHRWVSYTEWKNEWMTGVQPQLPALIPTWEGCFIAVVEADAKSVCQTWDTEALAQRRAAARAKAMSARSKLKYEETDEDLDKAMKAAVAELKALSSGDDATEPWDRLEGNPVVKWADLVQPDSPFPVPGGFYYYLMEIEAPDGSTPVAAMIDPKNFEMLESAAVDKPATDVLGRVELTKTTGNLLGRKVRLKGGEEIEVTQEHISTATLVWQHGPNSMSPFAPYWRISLAPPGVPDLLRKKTIYFRLDDNSLADELIGERNAVIDVSSYMGRFESKI